MKSLIFKEIRECGLMCLLGVIGLGLIVLGVVKGIVIHGSQNYSAPMVESSFHAATAFGFPALAVWIGMTQMIIDRRRGRWDFLVHRPMSRTRIFLCKAAVGSGLYLVSGMIPLLGAAVWLGTPGHVPAPFDWHMLQPRIADLFTGLVWYSVGMIVGARNARWLGSRIVPTGFAVFVSMIALIEAMNLMQAVLIDAAALAIALPAAWGAFVYGGEFRPQPVGIRFLEGVTLWPGLVVVWMLAVLLGSEVVDLIYPPPPERLIPTYSYQVLTSDGKTIGINSDGTFVSNQGQAGDSSVGRRFVRGEIQAVDQVYLDLSDPAQYDREERVGAFGFQNSSQYAQPLWYASTGAWAWYYLPMSRVIEAYAPVTCQYMGGVGINGFTNDPQPFPEGTKVPQPGLPVLVGPSAVYQVDRERRRITSVFTAPAGEKILSADQCFSAKSGADFAVVRTQSNFYVVQNGREIFHVPVENLSLPDYAVQVIRIDSGRFVFRYVDTMMIDPIAGDLIIETDSAGKAVSRQQMAAQHIAVNTDAEDYAAIFAVPPGIELVQRLAHVFSGSDGSIEFHAIDWCALGFVCAAVVNLLLPGYGATTGMRIVWTLIGFLGGVSGVLLLIALRPRVASVRCASCGRGRPVTEERCPNCQVAWEPMRRLGIEIFA